MNGRLWVFIEAEGAGVTAHLAAEVLRKAAAERWLNLSLSIQGAEGAEKLNDANLLGQPGLEPEAGDQVLSAGNTRIPAAFAGLPLHRVDLAAILEDAGKTLDSLPLGVKTGSASAVSAAATGPAAPGKRIVAVTSCPTGIAHTFMAAEGLQKAAEAMGMDIRVETQGSVGAGTPLTPEEIERADLVMIAADREVDRGRFNGKRVFSSPTKPAITDGQNLIKKAFAEAPLQKQGAAEQGGAGAAGGQAEKKAGPYKHLMTGVSFMLPFVVAGGLLIAIAFAVGGIHAGEHEGTLGAVLMLIGGQGGFALMVPALSGFIAYSIADRPGIAPGMIGGLLCNVMGAGFLGGIVSGFLAGYSVYYINKAIPLPKNLAGLKPVLILPLLGTLVTGLVMYYVIGGPAASLNVFLTAWLKGLQGTSSVALGLIIGGMMALDMGGPVNKAAYAFSAGLLEAGVYTPMAAAMAAGMTPPLAAALATRLFRNRFSAEEREAGSAAFVLGLAFVSEGAIPFAARDPLRVIPAFVLGSAITGAISMAFGVELMTPHGGVFVLPIPNAVSNLPVYGLAIVAGTVVSALIMGFLKKRIVPPAAAG